jgi:hypothetical protein
MIKFFYVILVILISGCGTIKDGLTLKKENSTDEFLVEKKNPLVMPPDYGKLPEPISRDLNNNTEKTQNSNKIKELLTTKNKESSEVNQTTSPSLRDSILKKIK